MWPMFAHHDDSRRADPGTFMHIFASRVQVGMCGPQSIVEIFVTENAGGPYWGWIATGEDRPSMIFSRKVQFDICFPYGVKVEVEHGKGRIVRLAIEEKCTKSTPIP